MSRKLAFQIDEETQTRLEYIGEASSMSKNHMAEEAIRQYAHQKERFIKAVRQGQEDARAGRVTGHEDLIEDLESRLADLD